LAAFLVFEFSYIFYSASWFEIVRKLNISMHSLRVFSIVGKTILARYAPAGDVVAKTFVINQEKSNVKNTTIIYSIFAGHFFLYLGSASIFLPLIIKNKIVLCIIYVFILLLLQYKGLPQLLSRIFKKDLTFYTSFNMWKAYLYAAVFFLIQAVSYYILFFPYGRMDFLTYVQILSISWFGGQVSSLPGGIGVREGLMVYYFKQYISNSEAMQVSIFFRLAQLFFELIIFLQFTVVPYIYNLYKRKFDAPSGLD
jgi:hypothetical protein